LSKLLFVISSTAEAGHVGTHTYSNTPAVVEVLGPLSNKYAVSVPATSHFFIACTYQLYFSF
jgi:hypothetical protein